MLELGVTVRMLSALRRLARRLEAITTIAKQPRDGLIADVEPVLSEHLGGQHACALAGPSQWRLGIAARDRIDELLQRRHKLGMDDFERDPTATLASGLDAAPGWAGPP